MDVAALRKATPSLPGLAHFNAASSGLLSSEVVEALQFHLGEEIRTSSHAAGLAAAEAIENARDEIAWLIGATAPEISFMSSNSEAWNLAVLSLPRLRPGDRVLVGGGEWGGNILTLAQECAAVGARLERIPELPDGRMDLSGLEEMMDDRLRLIAVTWIGAHLGHAVPVERIGRLARAAGVPFVVDAAQAAGVLPIDVNRIGCDILTAPGRKGLRGPKGSGFLYVREGGLEQMVPRPMNLRAASLVAGEVVQRRDGGRFEASEYARHCASASARRCDWPTSWAPGRSRRGCWSERRACVRLWPRCRGWSCGKPARRKVMSPRSTCRRSRPPRCSWLWPVAT